MGARSTRRKKDPIARGPLVRQSRSQALVELPSYAIPRGGYMGHYLWQIGTTSDALPIELCNRCGRTFIDPIEEPCDGD